MKILFSVASIAALAATTLGGAGAVSAHGSLNSTCADVGFLGVDVHGDHVIRDYVKGPDGTVGHGEGAFLPGGPGPGFHFPNGVAPGASFCNLQSNSPGLHFP